MINFPIENIPSLRSFLNRGNKMFKKTLPYKGFAKRQVTVTQEQVDAAKQALEELPPKNERA